MTTMVEIEAALKKVAFLVGQGDLPRGMKEKGRRVLMGVRRLTATRVGTFLGGQYTVEPKPEDLEKALKMVKELAADMAERAYLV
jgi:hypothetical protein